MIVAQADPVNTTSCVYCGRSRTTSRVPYVCLCGAVFGKSGWRRAVVASADRAAQQFTVSVDRLTRQRLAWSRLHMSNMRTMQEFESWLGMIPKACDCIKKVRRILAEDPPDFDNWFPWTVRFHNAVNESLDHPIVSMERARVLWLHERPQTDRTRCIVTVAHGIHANQLLRVTRPLMQAYADRCDADLIDLDNDTKDWWGLEKFRTYDFATQYEECLFLDADVIVKPDCPSLFGRSSNVAMHDDFSRLENSDWLRVEREEVSQLADTHIEHQPSCLNSGVVYTKRIAADAWRAPTSKIGTSHCAEQIWVEHQAKSYDIERLDSRFNWQWYFNDFRKGIDQAWIIHLANCPDKIAEAGRIIASLR